MTLLPIHRFGETGPCVLWLHGFLGSGIDAAGLLPECQVIAPDLPGHGAAADLRWDLEQTLSSLIPFLDREVWLAGYSMGGRLAAQLAARSLAPVRGLILESASPGLQDAQARKERALIDAQRAAALEEKGTLAFLEAWYVAPFWDSLPPERRERLIAKRASQDPEGLAHALRAFSVALQPDLRPWLAANSTCPLLWLAGSKDADYASIAHSLVLGTGRVVILPDAGHNVHLEKRAAWRNTVMEFLTNEPEET